MPRKFENRPAAPTILSAAMLPETGAYGDLAGGSDLCVVGWHKALSHSPNSIMVYADRGCRLSSLRCLSAIPSFEQSDPDQTVIQKKSIPYAIIFASIAWTSISYKGRLRNKSVLAKPQLRTGNATQPYRQSATFRPSSSSWVTILCRPPTHFLNALPPRGRCSACRNERWPRS